MIKKVRFPQPDFERSEWLSLNGEWEFSFDEPRYDSKINVPYPWGSPLSGISESRDGVGFYRRRVSWNPSQDRIFLIFGAVDFESTVRLNGRLLGKHRGGYDRFEFDVTDMWNRDGDNILEVAAEDFAYASQTVGKQYYGNARGIWQTVWLESRPYAYIKSFFVRTKIDGRVAFEVETVNANGGRISFTGYGAAVEVVNDRTLLELTVDSPKLWSPESPTLYYGSLVLDLGSRRDTVSTYFGIREVGSATFGSKGNRYITLNRKPCYINGVLDQSYNPDGFFTLPSDEDCKIEILRLKRIGINMARVHIKAEEPLKLYYADKLGLLIMEDMPNFNSEPTETARADWEACMEAQIRRDRNHPSVIAWVAFNESWGLFSRLRLSDGRESRAILPETAKWVEDCYRRIKALDPTRIADDNSTVTADHMITDLNSWHFYANGYERLRELIRKFCEDSTVGSSSNYLDGYTMPDVPTMNAECGLRVIGGKGEVDISWEYRYMINEFRRNDKLCGFVFTEFHDVVDEYNGFYRIDGSDKEFGYEEYGTSLSDIHSQDYLGADFAPMTTVKPGDILTVPMFASCFSEKYIGKTLDVSWQLITDDPIYGNAVADCGGYSLLWRDYGGFDGGNITLTIPRHDGIAELRWSLCHDGRRIMSNALLFDVDGQRENVLVLEPKSFRSGFEHTISAINGSKLSGIGSGIFEATIKTADIPNLSAVSELYLIFEASTRARIAHDLPDGIGSDYREKFLAAGYNCDSGVNPNTFIQTDEYRHSGIAEVFVDGIKIGECCLPDCPADSRGALSHHYQPKRDEFDEAGSYGYLCRLRLPSDIVMRLADKDEFVLTLGIRASGLSIYGRKSGRYGTGIVLMAENTESK